MPVIHKSTIRRARQAVKRHNRNRATLGALKSLVKKVQAAVAEKNKNSRSASSRWASENCSRNARTL